MLLRPGATTRAITLDQLKKLARDEEFVALLAQLRGEKSAAAHAMVWLLPGEKSAADAAVERMRGFKAGEDINSFKVYFGLRELALAYDWLSGYEGFTPEIRAEVRKNAAPLAAAGMKIGDAHLFHNYVLQASGGTMLWALATAGEDAESDKLYEAIRARLNTRLLPGLEYLDGAPGEPMWYWALYDLSPAALAVLGAQSASEQDLFGLIRDKHGDFLARQQRHTLLCTFPDLSYAPFGDTKVGPDGGVTHEMAGVLAGLSWALGSGEGAWFDRWVAGKRGARRFYGETAVFYFLYARNLPVPVEPPLAMLAGGKSGGEVVSRSGWDDDAAVVAFRCTDHFGDHNHFDQGSFIVFRHGMLAIDQRAYKKVAGPQQPTATHNTLLIGGQGQRPVRGQDFRTLADFQAALPGRLETGDMLFYQDAKDYTAAAGQFAQAYRPETVRSCVRQLLFVRPGTVAVVDQLAAPEGRELGEILWLLHVPAGARFADGALVATNGKSFLRCRQLLPGGGGEPEKSEALEKSCERFAFPAKGGAALVLVHVLEIGDGAAPDKPLAAEAKPAAGAGGGVEVRLGERTFLFGGAPEFKVEPLPAAGSR